jgi:hypothetical protein
VRVWNISNVGVVPFVNMVRESAYKPEAFNPSRKLATDRFVCGFYLL